MMDREEGKEGVILHGHFMQPSLLCCNHENKIHLKWEENVERDNSENLEAVCHRETVEY